MAIEGVLQEGFVTTTADKLINYMRTGSMWPMTFGLACCAVEMIHAGCARYDLFPWATIFKDIVATDSIKLFGFIEMLVFVAILVIGYVYAWAKGALEWE